MKRLLSATGELRTLTADWATAVYPIFWSVWWGFFIEKLFNLDQDLQIKIPWGLGFIDLQNGYYLLASGLLVSFYSLIYVRWLLNARKTTRSTVNVREFIGFSIYYLVAHSMLLGSILIVLYSSDGSLNEMINYGIVLTVAWFVVMVTLLWPNQ